MKSINSVTEDTPAVSDSVDITARDALTEILRAGAQKMLKAAIEKEVSDYVNERTDIVDKDGRQLVVRNGSLPERVILTGIGPVTVRQPRVTERTTLRLECPLSIRQPCSEFSTVPTPLNSGPFSVYPLGLNTTIRNRLEQSRHEYGQDGSGRSTAQRASAIRPGCGWRRVSSAATWMSKSPGSNSIATNQHSRREELECRSLIFKLACSLSWK